MKQHKWHNEIKAWADGVDIECRYDNNEGWHSVDKQIAPIFAEKHEYRIKPQPKEPQYLYAWETELGMAITSYKDEIPKQYKYMGKIELEQDDD